jgi:hypothetical protein
MKNKRKLGFRIWVLFSVALFLLIPLLSSPVAATVNFDNMGVRTNNSANFPLVAVLGPPTYSYDLPGNYSDSDDGSGSVKFAVDCYIEDNKPLGNGSDHYVELNVQRVSPSIGQLLQTSTGIITLAANSRNNPYPQTIQITTTYTKGDTFCAYIYAECEDLQTSQKAWYTWYWNYTVT